MDLPTTIFLACIGLPSLAFLTLFIASGLRANKTTAAKFVEANDDGDNDYNFYGRPSIKRNDKGHYS